jgi:chromate transporter
MGALADQRPEEPALSSSSKNLARPSRHPGTVGEVFVAFLRLGLTSFGGPIAHLGYFREAFVVRRRWLTEKAYADVVALCQFLPGPASSQVGMALGLQRAGYGGLLAAWVAFTLPSAILLVGFAYGLGAMGDVSDAGWVSGLKAAAVAVVAQAVFGMARTLTPDRERATIAVAALIGALLMPTAFGQVAVIAIAGLVGLLLLRPDLTESTEDDALDVRVGHRTAIGCLVLFGVFLAAVLAVTSVTSDGIVGLASTFYRAGALVFGGGHVVLPLLEADTVGTGLVTHDEFLAGYGATQAVPGPLFTFSAFLGASSDGTPTGIAGAAVALVAIFLPSMLLTIGALPYWARLRHAITAQRALMGLNAGVVGILAAALYDPVFTSGITSTEAFTVAAAAFVALTAWKAPPWVVVVLCGVVGQLAL